MNNWVKQEVWVFMPWMKIILVVLSIFTQSTVTGFCVMLKHLSLHVKKFMRKLTLCSLLLNSSLKYLLYVCTFVLQFFMYFCTHKPHILILHFVRVMQFSSICWTSLRACLFLFHFFMWPLLAGDCILHPLFFFSFRRCWLLIDFSLCWYCCLMLSVF